LAAMPPKRRSPGAHDLCTPSTRPVRRRISPASHSPAATPSLRHIPRDSPEWADPGTTCLSLGLNPSNADHSGVTCNNCKFFWEKKLGCNVANLANEERSSRRMMCDRPFDCSDTGNNNLIMKHIQYNSEFIIYCYPTFLPVSYNCYDITVVLICQSYHKRYL